MTFVIRQRESTLPDSHPCVRCKQTATVKGPIHSPPKDFGSDPISGDESAVTQGEQRAEVCTTPEIVRHNASAGELKPRP